MLALILRTPKIYILIRKSDKRAVDRWTQTMPKQWWDLVTSGSIEFDPMLGIGKDVLKEMKKKVTLIIHAAANISFKSSINEAIADNCLPSLRMADITSEFEKLGCFVQVSTAYANSFLPDGLIEERSRSRTSPDQVKCCAPLPGGFPISLCLFQTPYGAFID
jgi:Male sterility protein